jgi:hypothetical protein
VTFAAVEAPSDNGTAGAIAADILGLTRIIRADILVDLSAGGLCQEDIVAFFGRIVLQTLEPAN